MTLADFPHAIEALYWETKQSGSIRCLLCPHHCVLREGKTGICRVKKNVKGKLMAIAYGLSTSFTFDPIEKKPLYHFYPGTSILSIGPNSCNLDCRFCQNYHVSQMNVPTNYLPAEDVAKEAERDNCIGVAYTYSEPLMWYEYIIDSAKAVRARNLKTVLVTNGMLEPEPFRELLPLIDALNIDIKSMDGEFYKKTCKGKLEPVLRNVEEAIGKAHVEITNLVIPGLNDSEDDFNKLTDFIANLDPLIPLHFSRYHPAYKLDTPATPVATLVRAREIARKKLKYVYIGNAYVRGTVNTICPYCNAMLIDREGELGSVGVNNGHCAKCDKKVNITDAA